MNKLKNKRGWTLIELIISLGVITILSTLIFIVVVKANNAIAINNITKSVQTFASKGVEMTNTAFVYAPEKTIYPGRILSIECYYEEEDCFKKYDMHEAFTFAKKGGASLYGSISKQDTGRSDIYAEIGSITSPEVCTNVAFKLMNAYQNIHIENAGGDSASYDAREPEVGVDKLTIPQIAKVCDGFGKGSAGEYVENFISLTIYESEI